MSRCKKCETILRNLARQIANCEAADLFQVASNSKIIAVSVGSLQVALRAPEVWTDNANEWTQLDLPPELLPTGSGDFVGVNHDEIRRAQGKKPLLARFND